MCPISCKFDSLWRQFCLAAVDEEGYYTGAQTNESVALVYHTLVSATDYFTPAQYYISQ